MEFVVLYQPRRQDQALPQAAELKKVPGAYYLTAKLSDGSVRAILPTRDGAALQIEGLQCKGAVAVERLSPEGRRLQTLNLDSHRVP